MGVGNCQLPPILLNMKGESMKYRILLLFIIFVSSLTLKAQDDILIIRADNLLITIELSNFEIVSDIRLDYANIASVIVSHDYKYVYFIAYESTSPIINPGDSADIIQFDLENRKYSSIYQLANVLSIAGISSDDSRLIIRFIPDTESIFRPSSPNAFCILEISANECTEFNNSPSTFSVEWVNNNSIFGVSREANIPFWGSLDDFSLTELPSFGYVGSLFQYLASENVLAFMSYEERNSVSFSKYDANSLDMLSTMSIPIPYERIQFVEISPDGNYLLVGDERHSILVELEDNMILKEFDNIIDVLWDTNSDGFFALIYFEGNYQAVNYVDIDSISILKILDVSSSNHVQMVQN